VNEDRRVYPVRTYYVNVGLPPVIPSRIMFSKNQRNSARRIIDTRLEPFVMFTFRTGR